MLHQKTRKGVAPIACTYKGKSTTYWQTKIQSTLPKASKQDFSQYVSFTIKSEMTITMNKWLQQKVIETEMGERKQMTAAEGNWNWNGAEKTNDCSRRSLKLKWGKENKRLLQKVIETEMVVRKQTTAAKGHWNWNGGKKDNENENENDKNKNKARQIYKSTKQPRCFPLFVLLG